MQTLFSTSNVEPRLRFDYWHDVACKELIQHDSVPDDRMAFSAILRRGTLSAAEVILYDHSAETVSHSLRHVTSADTGHLFLCRLGLGRFRLDQVDRTGVLESGDMVLLDPRLTYAAAFPESSRVLVLKLPRLLVTDRLGDVRELLACPIKRGPGEKAMLSGLLATLPNHLDSLDGPTSGLTTDYLLGLLAHAVGRA